MCSVGEEVFDFACWRDLLTDAETCSECERVIPPQSELVYQASFHTEDDDPDGPPPRYRCCRHCERLSQWLEKQCGQSSMGSVLEEVHDHVLDRSYNEDNDVVLPFRERLTVARHVTHAFKKWQRPDGTLRERPPPLFPVARAVAAPETETNAP